MKRFLAAVLAAAFTMAASPPTITGSYFTNLHWRMIGPFRGGRALAVTGVPGQPEHFYFGAVDGGVWESFDAGRTWKPIFDAAGIGSIGSIAVAPSAPNVLYVGSGEADMRSDIAYGNAHVRIHRRGEDVDGIAASRKLAKSVRSSSIRTIPRRSLMPPRSAPSNTGRTNAARRVQNSSTPAGSVVDKGSVQRREHRAAVSLAMNPQDPNVLYAALWQTRRPPWNVYPPSNGPGSGLYKSIEDAGRRPGRNLTNGLPAHVRAHRHRGVAVKSAAGLRERG